MSFKNHWTINSSCHFQAHQQHSQRGCYYTQTALQWFAMLLGLSPVLRGLSLALPGFLLALPGAILVVTRPPMSTQIFHQRSLVHVKATAYGQSTLGFDYTGILVQQLPNTPRDSQMLPVTIMDFAYILEEALVGKDVRTAKCGWPHNEIWRDVHQPVEIQVDNMVRRQIPGRRWTVRQWAHLKFSQTQTLRWEEANKVSCCTCSSHTNTIM